MNVNGVETGGGQLRKLIDHKQLRNHYVTVLIDSFTVQ
jgi:hypothetical protein